VSWLAICLIWGTTYLAIRIALETMPPALMAGLRWLTGGVLLAAIHVGRGQKLPPRAAWPGLAVIGFLFIVGGNGFVVWAEQWVPSGLTSVLLATTPFWMVGIEALLPGGERPHLMEWIGLAVGFGGILVLVWPDLAASGAGSRNFVAGLIGLQLACFTWSLGSAYERRHTGAEHTLGGAAVEMIFGGLMLTALGTATGEWSHLTFSTRSIAAFAYLVLVGSLVGYSAYIHTLKHLPVSTISLYSYINPIIAVVLGTLVADEPFGLRSLVASGVVFVGVTIVRARSFVAVVKSAVSDSENGAHA
jgi:drug/metabolite transporter (DMT)-like permease